MTRRVGLILALGATAAAALGLAYSFLSRARAAEEDRFVWGTVSEARARRGAAAAHRLLDDRLAAHPRDSLLLYYKARLYYESGQAAPALEYSDRAIALGYAQEISHLLKALVHGRLLNNFEEQRELAAKALSFDPTYDDAYIARAEARHRLGDYAGCVSDAISYSGLSPGDPYGLETELLCRESSGDFKGAEKTAQALLKKTPGSHEAFWRLGRIYAATGRHALAIKEFGRAIEISGGKPRYYVDRALSCEAEGDLSCAAWDYFVAVSWPEISSQATYYLALGSAMHRVGELGEALSAAGKAVEKAPGAPEGYLLRGRVLAERGKTREAAADFRRAAALSPSYKAETDQLLLKLADPSLR